uniref:Carbohydrate kinase PfkB domain-containing protein n=1 Tax=Schlesneria paludicola TaxID=360056 RepID=A0A7C4QQC5_9PLAN
MVILAAGLTPAWQHILIFPRLVPGEVNRAAEAVWCASGKVLNVACAVHHLVRPAPPTPHTSPARSRAAAVRTVCLIGGLTGEAIRRDFAALGISARWVESSVPTRVCTTLLEQSTGQTTELVENSAAVSAEDLSRFAAAFAEEARSAELIVVSGSLPRGTPPDYFLRLLEEVRCPVLLDVRGPELRACLPLKPWLVKPNREELAATLGRRLDGDHDMMAAMEELRRAGAEYVVVSDGPRAVWAMGPDGVHRAEPPPVQVVNPIGSGDCLAAGLAVARVEGLPWREGLEFALAAAADNAAHLLPARISRPKPW